MMTIATASAPMTLIARIGHDRFDEGPFWTDDFIISDESNASRTYGALDPNGHARRRGAQQNDSIVDRSESEKRAFYPAGSGDRSVMTLTQSIAFRP
jgi:hypothetical protein